MVHVLPIEGVGDGGEAGIKDKNTAIRTVNESFAHAPRLRSGVIGNECCDVIVGIVGRVDAQIRLNRAVNKVVPQNEGVRICGRPEILQFRIAAGSAIKTFFDYLAAGVVIQIFNCARRKALYPLRITFRDAIPTGIIGILGYDLAGTVGHRYEPIPRIILERVAVLIGGQVEAWMPKSRCGME